MNKVSSRSTQLNNDECVENIGNRFNLVLVAAARAREISSKQKADRTLTYLNSGVTALIEIQDKQIGKEYLRKVR